MFKFAEIRRAFRIGIDLFFLTLFLFIISEGYFKQNIKPDLMNFVANNTTLLFLIMFAVFVVGASLLIFIVWWTEYGEKQKVSPLVRHISQLVCKNYYGDYRKTNIYRAIKTCLSKFSRDSLNAEEENRQQQKNKKGLSQDTSCPHYEVDPQFFKKSQNSAAPLADGIYRAYHPNGRIESEMTYKKGMLDGPYFSFYPDGKLHQEKFFKNGKLDGLFKAFDEQGILYFDICYKDGKQDGLMNTYTLTGILQYRDMYKEGEHIYRETYNHVGELVFRQEYHRSAKPKDKKKSHLFPFKNRLN